MRPLPRIPAAGEKITTAIFRDIINYLRAITPKAGAGVRVSQGPNGTTIDSTATGTKKAYGADGKTLPFTLRMHTTADDDQGQLEVYLPRGSMTTEEDCVPLNAPASNRTGHDEEDDWYTVETKDISSGDTLSITAYVMPGHHMIVAPSRDVDDIYPRAAIVTYHLADLTATDDDDGNLVLRVGKQINTGSKHTTSTAVYAHGTNNLEWTLEKNQQGVWEIKKLELKDVVFDAGGLMLTADAAEIPEDAQKVYLKIDHSSQDYQLSVVTDPEDDANTDDVTWRLLFDVEQRYPIVDYRFTLNTMLFLR